MTNPIGITNQMAWDRAGNLQREELQFDRWPFSVILTSTLIGGVGAVSLCFGAALLGNGYGYNKEHQILGISFLSVSGAAITIFLSILLLRKVHNNYKVSAIRTHNAALQLFRENIGASNDQPLPNGLLVEYHKSLEPLLEHANFEQLRALEKDAASDFTNYLRENRLPQDQRALWNALHYLKVNYTPEELATLISQPMLSGILRSERGVIVVLLQKMSRRQFENPQIKQVLKNLLPSMLDPEKGQVITDPDRVLEDIRLGSSFDEAVLHQTLPTYQFTVKIGDHQISFPPDILEMMDDHLMNFFRENFRDKGTGTYKGEKHYTPEVLIQMIRLMKGETVQPTKSSVNTLYQIGIQYDLHNLIEITLNFYRTAITKEIAISLLEILNPEWDASTNQTTTLLTQLSEDCLIRDYSQMTLECVDLAVRFQLSRYAEAIANIILHDTPITLAKIVLFEKMLPLVTVNQRLSFQGRLNSYLENNHTSVRIFWESESVLAKRAASLFAEQRASLAPLAFPKGILPDDLLEFKDQTPG